MSTAARTTAPAHATPPSPWGALDADGTGLELEQFLSFHVIRLAHALQRTTGRAYLDGNGLTGPDWRVLGFVRGYGPVQFGELTARAALDKAQVSRTVKSLRERGLVTATGDTGHAQRVVLAVTPAGARLHARVLPQAARTQAQLLHALAPAERDALWSALHALREHIGEPPAAQSPKPPVPAKTPRKKP